jgi:hypothetical protein
LGAAGSGFRRIYLVAAALRQAAVKIKPLISASLIALATIQARGQGTVILDQASYSGPITLDQAFAIQPGQPVGQSFTPSLSAVGFVNIVLIGGGTGGSVYINILSNSITGPVLGSSESVVVGPSSTGVFTFNFDTPVDLTPGVSYFFRPIVGPANSNIETPSVTGYSGGTAYHQGNPSPFGGDLEFQEGIYVPEPSTWALLILAGGALWFTRRIT